MENNEEIKPLTVEELDIIAQEAEKLLGKLHITATCEAQEQDQAAHVLVNTEESGILIGYHGETLQSFQFILSLITTKKLGRFVRVIVNVGDYREKREEKLRQIALDAAKRARETGKSVTLPNLLPWQRRVVHMTLQENPDVVTESEGEEPNRQLVIKTR